MIVYHYSAFKDKINVSKKGSIGNGYIYTSLYPFKNVGDDNDIGNRITSLTTINVDENRLIIFGKRWYKQIHGSLLGYYEQAVDEHSLKVLQSDDTDLNRGINKMIYAEIMKRNDVYGVAFPHDTELGNDNLEIVIKP